MGVHLMGYVFFKETTPDVGDKQQAQLFNVCPFTTFPNKKCMFDYV